MSHPKVSLCYELSSKRHMLLHWDTQHRRAKSLVNVQGMLPVCWIFSWSQDWQLDSWFMVWSQCVDAGNSHLCCWGSGTSDDSFCHQLCVWMNKYYDCLKELRKVGRFKRRRINPFILISQDTVGTKTNKKSPPPLVNKMLLLISAADRGAGGSQGWGAIYVCPPSSPWHLCRQEESRADRLS